MKELLWSWGNALWGLFVGYAIVLLGSDPSWLGAIIVLVLALVVLGVSLALPGKKRDDD